MTEGVLKEWLVTDGCAVKEGDIIYTLESVKALQEIESPGTGVLRIIAAEGETYQVGEVLGEII